MLTYLFDSSISICSVSRVELVRSTDPCIALLHKIQESQIEVTRDTKDLLDVELFQALKDVITCVSESEFGDRLSSLVH